MRVFFDVEHCLLEHFFLDVFSLYFLEEEGGVLKPGASLDWLLSKIANFFESTDQLHKAGVSEGASKDLLGILQVVNLFVCNAVAVRISLKSQGLVELKSSPVIK